MDYKKIEHVVFMKFSTLSIGVTFFTVSMLTFIRSFGILKNQLSSFYIADDIIGAFSLLIISLVFIVAYREMNTSPSGGTFFTLVGLFFTSIILFLYILHIGVSLFEHVLIEREGYDTWNFRDDFRIEVILFLIALVVMVPTIRKSTNIVAKQEKK